MTTKRRYNFNLQDMNNLMQAVASGHKLGKDYISFSDLLEFGYDKDSANILVSFGDTMKQYVERIDRKDGIYMAILKKPQ